ncbi:MAG: hypothetical protein IPM46_13005 [Flavobacteriales bacterium]|nr:hypothetical protein [Flavobacteriales bacterium]
MSRSARIRLGLLVLAMAIFSACATQPSKYRKKRGCDCPQWNRVPDAGEGTHARHALVAPTSEPITGS